ncbi:MAG: DUF3696 domain-containing protein [Anaerolineaceae bacterium]
MIAFRWKNFRCFQDTGWIDLKPLTILIGPNNSGKTSLIMPLLLMKQTIECGDNSTPLTTKGQLIDVGSFKELIFQHNLNLPLELSLRFNKTDFAKKKPALGELPPGEISITFTSKEKIYPDDVQLENFEVFDILERKLLNRKRLQNNKYSIEFLPEGKFSEDVEKIIKNDNPVNFYFTDKPIQEIFSLFAKKQDGNEKGMEKKTITLDEGTSLYLPIMSFIEKELKKLLKNITFIGPIREPTKRFYEFSGVTPKNVGIKGEATPEIIARCLDRKMQNWINKWISVFEFGGLLKIDKSEKDIFSMEIFSKNKQETNRVNLADTGFGFSQLLPLIIQSYILHEGGLLITEQPEIHLNPKLQCVLADLFVDTVKSGKNVLVETHSEHLILRLRRLIAEEKIRSDEIKIYFIEKVNNSSIIKNIPILPNGHIRNEDWPQDFFEDSLRESLGLAESQIKRGK